MDVYLSPVMKRRFLTPMLLGAVASAISSCLPQEVTIAATPGRKDADLRVQVNGPTALVEVFSPSGMGNAEVRILSPETPEHITLRLHLRGLEDLRLITDSCTILLSVTPGRPNSIRQTLLTPESGEISLTPGSPKWISLGVVAADGSAGEVPLSDGYIDVEVPQATLGGGSRVISFRWIDSYR